MTNLAPGDTDALRVGGYELLSLIGEGGMGVVHLARRLGSGPHGDRVALKVLRPHVVGDQEARDRLAREVASLSRVRSPRVAEILDADPYGPQPFVVTRYVPGPPLHEHVREHGPLAEIDLHHVGALLAEALAAVHRVGVVHRDIKPANVLLEGRSPVLIDFGLARLAEDPRLTATGWLLGTPGYLAPEVLYGDPPSTASDVHAWAATMVFAATGRPPAGRGPAMAIMDRVRRGEFDLGGVPPSLEPLLRSALSADPAVRPTVPQLLARLGGVPPPSPAPVPLVEPTRVLPTDTSRRLAFAAGVQSRAASTQAGLQSRAASTQAGLQSRAASTDMGEREQFRRGRHRLALAGIGLVGVGLVAWAPYVGAVVLAAVVGLLRFASVTSQRHTERHVGRGRRRWYDVPASVLASPGYLAFSLVGTIVLVCWAVAVVAALTVLLALAGASLPVGLGSVAVAYVASLWWGPASGRVRERLRLSTRRAGRPTRTGPVLAVAGLVVATVALVAVASSGPRWSPASAAPWSGTWVGQVSDALH